MQNNIIHSTFWNAVLPFNLSSLSLFAFVISGALCSLFSCADPATFQHIDITAIYDVALSIHSSSIFVFCADVKLSKSSSLFNASTQPTNAIYPIQKFLKVVSLPSNTLVILLKSEIIYIITLIIAWTWF